MWDLTPRRLAAFHFVMGKRKKHEAARDLSLFAAGARGDPKAVKKAIKEWEKA